MGDTNKFQLINTSSDSRARRGELITPHGKVPTPVFMPVASQGSVKTLNPDEVKNMGIAMVLANAYHLYLRPGVSLIEKMGGLHKFIGWDGALLTDSGGYQVFSLASLRRVNDEGVVFRSHIDGSQHLLTPELDIQFQESIGADIIMVLDECVAHDADYEKVKEAMDRTHRWAERCRKSKKNDSQNLFAIVQGGTFPDLRRQSVERLTAMDFPGYAIGGLSLGETKQLTMDIVEGTAARLPEEKPRYLMGAGSPEDIVRAVDRGIDMFDSSLPTRVARNGTLLTRLGRLNIRNAAYSTTEQAVDTDCGCYTCRNYSAAYLHHLFDCRELLAPRLATVHNLTFISHLMSDIRDAISNDRFGSFRDDFLGNYQPTDEAVRLDQKRKWRQARQQKS